MPAAAENCAMSHARSRMRIVSRGVPLDQLAISLAASAARHGPEPGRRPDHPKAQIAYEEA